MLELSEAVNEKDDKDEEEVKVGAAVVKSDGGNTLDSFENFVASMGDWQTPLKNVIESNEF